jgi:type 1 fimbria pilin
MKLKIVNIWATLLFLCLFAGSQNAFAFSCNMSTTITSNINLSDVDDIGDEYLVYDYTRYTCNGWGSANYLDALRISEFQKYSVLDGSGLELYFKDNGVYYDYSSAIYRCVWPWSGTSCSSNTYSDGTYPMKGQLILRRTSTTKPGVVIAANSLLARIRFQQRGNYGSGSSWGTNGYTISVYNNDSLTFPTCDVDNSSQNQIITLQDVSKSAFSGVGTTVNPTHFSIKLNCKAGVSVYASVTDSNQLTNPGPNLSLDGTSSASGVRVQLLYNNTPIQFGSSNQFYVAGSDASPEMSHTVPFEARYVQTAASITSGSVGAKAVISFEYL